MFRRRNRTDSARSFQRIFKQVAPWCLAGTMFAVFSGLYIIPRSLNRQDLQKLERALGTPPVNHALTFLDADNQPFDAHDFDNKIYTNLRLTQIDPEFLADLLAVEDRSYRTHRGVDFSATLNAAFNYLLEPVRHLLGHAKSRRGGGSTITQQLIKNILKHRRRTPWIKLREIHLALELHERLEQQQGEKTRDVILEQYLNRFYVTERIRGLRNAARIYLGRGDVRRLAPRERRLLLAVLHAPGAFQKGSAQRRQKLLGVIHGRLRAGGRATDEGNKRKPGSYYTGEAGAQARRDAFFRNRPRRRAQTNFAASYLHVFNPPPLYGNVRTHRMSKLNRAMNERLFAYLKKINRDSRDGCAKAGAYILIRVRDGAVVASGDSPCDEYNETVQLRRQIHSTFKPILYATAFPELGVGPATIYTDKRVTFYDDLGRPYAPGNNYRIFKGRITLKRALQFSSNTISLQLLHGFSPHTLVGQSQKVFALYPGEKLRHQFHVQPSLALGTVHLSPAHLSAAFLTLLSGGLKKYPAWIRRDTDVVNQPGLDAPPEQVLQRAASYQVREMLTAVVRLRGTGGLHLEHITNLIVKDLGGKSGSGPRDSWFAGFSQDLLLVAWTGYRRQLTASVKNFSAIPLWKRLFLETIPYFPPRALQHPSELRRAYYCKHSGQALSKSCPRLESALFPPGAEPTEKCRLHGPRNQHLP